MNKNNNMPMRRVSPEWLQEAAKRASDLSYKLYDTISDGEESAVVLSAVCNFVQAAAKTLELPIEEFIDGIRKFHNTPMGHSANLIGVVRIDSKTVSEKDNNGPDNSDSGDTTPPVRPSRRC